MQAVVNSYLVGTRPTVTFLLTNLAGAPVNATVAVTAKTPGGVPSALSTANPATGTYTATPLLDAAGDWWLTFTASGAVDPVVSQHQLKAVAPR